MKYFSSFLTLTISILFTSLAYGSLQFDANVQPGLKSQILHDFNFIQGIKGNNASPLHQRVFGEVDGTNYFAWFSKRVFSVGFNDCGNPAAVACVQEAPNKIWMTNNYIQFNHPQIARLATVYHEARHTEVDNKRWPHAACPTPFKDHQGNNVQSIWTGSFLSGQYACDITAYGSYGSASIFLKNIGKYCINCSEKVMADANLYGNDQMERVIDPVSLKNMITDLNTKSSTLIIK